jgi:hypothetical protein
MPTVISGTSITFNDNTVQSANAITSTAAALHGQLGSYAYLSLTGNTTARTPGFTVAGTSLKYVGDGVSGTGAVTQAGWNIESATVPPGSWRLMGALPVESVTSGKTTVTIYGRAAVWLRYA